MKLTLRQPFRFARDFQPCKARVLCSRSEISVGIDLGTTNSTVAVVVDGKPTVIRNEEHSLITPSVVAYLDGGEVVVGNAARRVSSKNPRNTFYSVKRLLGRSYQEVMAEGRQLAYEIVAGSENEVLVECRGECLRPEEISARLIRHLLDCVQRECGVNEIKRCVISVPAYFTEKQRAATITAGLESGLEKVRLIHEPVASALAYGLDLMEDQTVCVFDLGGGTLDICILELGNGVTEVLATGGDSQLGGDDIDALIMDWLRREQLPNFTLTPNLKSNLKKLAETAKIKLSTANKVKLKIPLEKPVEAMLMRQHLEKMSKPLFKKMRDALDRCCWQADVDLVSLQDSLKDQDEKISICPKKRLPLSEILLVGAATKMPALRSFLRNMTSLEVRDTVDPVTCVAVGAALEAARLSGELKEGFMTMDVWQASLLRALANTQASE